MIADDHSNLRHCGVVLGSHILIRCKTNLSVISTLNNMYRHTNRKIASSSWHRKGLLVIRYWAILSTPVSSKRRHYSQCCEKKLGCRARQWLEVMSANWKFYSDPIYSTPFIMVPPRLTRYAHYLTVDKDAGVVPVDRVLVPQGLIFCAGQAAKF